MKLLSCDSKASFAHSMHLLTREEIKQRSFLTTNYTETVFITAYGSLIVMLVDTSFYS